MHNNPLHMAQTTKEQYAMWELNNEVTFFLCLDNIDPTYLDKMHFLTICSRVLQRWNNALNSLKSFLGLDLSANGSIWMQLFGQN